MQIKVNGESREFPGPMTVAELVAALGISPKQVAVELHGGIVPRSTYADVAVNDGDQIEIVQFIGGG